jgi:hypothetical protein
MVNIEVLKKLTFIADLTKKLEPFLFEDIEIRINTLLEKSDDVIYAFQVLKIPFTPYEPESKNAPEEINVNFGCEIGVNVIYLLTYILKEVFNDTLDVYIDYATEPEGREKKAMVGTYLTKEKNFTNISGPIALFEILRLDITNTGWKEFRSLFPNNNYSDDGTCTYIQDEFEHSDDYDDYHRTYGQEELQMADWDYDATSPAHDQNENPWIDVFGPGDEAESAYWNTD